MGWLAATTFRLFLDLVAVSVSSFWVGSTDTFLGFPSVTRDEAMAMPRKDTKKVTLSLPGEAGGYLECLAERGCGLQLASSLSETARQPCYPHTAPALSDSDETSYVFFWTNLVKTI